MMASALASALTMVGDLKLSSVGSDAQIADGVAQVVGGDVDVGLLVEFDRHLALAGARRRGDGDNAGDARHGALNDTGDFLIDRVGRGAGVVGAHGDHRPVDIGQLAHLDAAPGCQTGDDDQQVEDDGQNRPANEQAGDPAVMLSACGLVLVFAIGSPAQPFVARRGPAPLPAPLPRLGRCRLADATGRGLGRGAFGLSGTIAGSRIGLGHLAAFAQALQALDDHRIVFRQIAADDDGAAAPAENLHVDAMGAAVGDLPHIGPGAIPLHGQRRHGRMRRAGEAHGDGKRHARLENVGIVGQRRLDFERPRHRIDAVVDRRDGALEALAGKRLGGGGDRLADGHKARRALRHVEGDRHLRHVVERGNRLGGADEVADGDIGEPDDAGEGRLDGALGEIVLGRLQTDRGVLLCREGFGEGDGGDVVRFGELPGAVERRLRGVEGDLRLFERHLLVGIVEADEGRALGDLGARGEGDLGDDAAILGIEGHLLRRRDGTDGAHIDPRVVGRDRHGDHQHRAAAAARSLTARASAAAGLPGAGRTTATALVRGKVALVVGVPARGGDQDDDEREDNLSDD